MTKAPKKNVKVLVVDDDTELVSVLKESLEGMGCETFVAPDGLEAMKLLERESVTLVMADIRMPRMGGLSLLEAMHKRGLEIPVVLMSGDTDASAVEVDERDGAILLTKPFSRSQIREIIELYG